MNRADITELHYITAIANLPSILRHGILSHKLANQLAHASVAMPEIQERRTNKQIPGARLLHDYANLYFDAHNPMLSRCRARNNEICVLRIDPAVMDQADVIVTDRNAAADLVGSGLWMMASLLLPASGCSPDIGRIQTIFMRRGDIRRKNVLKCWFPIV
jgi:hypothetical protein